MNASHPIFATALAAQFLLPSSHTIAGTNPSSAPAKEPVTQPAPSSPLWEITVRPYGWLAGVEGETGVKGYTVATDVGFDQILENLDMVVAMQFEVKRDRWSFLFDGLYLKLSGESETPGRLLQSAGVELEQLMIEAAIGFRLWDGPRGFVDVLAGARYLRLESELTFTLDDQGVASLSEDISQLAVSRISEAVRDAVRGVTAEAKPRITQQISQSVTSLVHSRVASELADHPNLPELGRILRRTDGPLNDAVRELVAARLQSTQAAGNETVAALKARAQQKAEQAITRAEKKLASRIEDTIREAVPESVSGSKDWIDPFVGLRGRYNFTDRLYAVGRADIGGFSIGSELSWQLYGALGWQFTPRSFVEVGYRYLDVDYSDDGFTYDMAMGGAFIGFGMTF